MMVSRQSDSPTAFAGLACGFLTGFATSGIALLKLELISSATGQTPMSYADLAALVLSVATLVVAVLIPAFGIFGYIIARREAIAIARQTVLEEANEGGKISELARQEILKTIDDESGSLRLYIQRLIEAQKENRIEESYDEFELSNKERA